MIDGKLNLTWCFKLGSKVRKGTTIRQPKQISQNVSDYSKFNDKNLVISSRPTKKSLDSKNMMPCLRENFSIREKLAEDVFLSNQPKVSTRFLDRGDPKTRIEAGLRKSSSQYMNLDILRVDTPKLEERLYRPTIASYSSHKQLYGDMIVNSNRY